MPSISTVLPSPAPKMTRNRSGLSIADITLAFSRVKTSISRYHIAINPVNSLNLVLPTLILRQLLFHRSRLRLIVFLFLFRCNEEKRRLV